MLDFKGFTSKSKIYDDRLVSEIGDQEREMQPNRCMYFNNNWKIVIGNNNNKSRDDWNSGTIWFNNSSTSSGYHDINGIYGVEFNNFNDRFFSHFGLTSNGNINIRLEKGDNFNIYVGEIRQYDGINEGIKSINSFNDGNWHFCYWEILDSPIVSSNSHFRIKVYIDNILVIDVDDNKVDDNTTNIFNRHGPSTIGGRSFNSFQGYLFDARVFTKPKTSDELEKIKKGEIVGDVFYHFKMDEGIGNIAYENSQNQYHSPIQDGSSDISTVHVTDSDLPFNFQNKDGYNLESYQGIYDEVDDFSNYSVQPNSNPGNVGNANSDVVGNWWVQEGSSLSIQGTNLQIDIGSGVDGEPENILEYTQVTNNSEVEIRTYPRKYRLTLDIDKGDNGNPFQVRVYDVFEQGGGSFYGKGLSDGVNTIEFTPKDINGIQRLIILCDLSATYYQIKSYKLEDISEQIVPKDSNSKYNDVLGNRLQYQDQVKYPSKFVESNCLEFDGNSYIEYLNTYGSGGILSTGEGGPYRFEFEFIPYNVSKNFVKLISLGGTNTAGNIALRPDILILRFQVYDDDYNSRFETFTLINSLIANEYYKVILYVYPDNGSTVICYVNGELTINEHRVHNGTSAGGGEDLLIGDGYEGKLWNIKIHDLDNDLETLYLPFSEGEGSATHNIAKDVPTGTEITEIQTSNDINNLWKTQNHFHYNLLNGFRREIYEYSDNYFSHITANNNLFRISYIPNGFRLTALQDVNSNSITFELNSELFTMESGVKYYGEFKHRSSGNFGFRSGLYDGNSTVGQGFSTSPSETTHTETTIRRFSDHSALGKKFGITHSTFYGQENMKKNDWVEIWDLKLEQLSYIPLKEDGETDIYGNTNNPNRITNPTDHYHNKAETKLDFIDGKPNTFNNNLPSIVDLSQDYDGIFKENNDKFYRNLIVKELPNSYNAKFEGNRIVDFGYHPEFELTNFIVNININPDSFSLNQRQSFFAVNYSNDGSGNRHGIWMRTHENGTITFFSFNGQNNNSILTNEFTLESGKNNHFAIWIDNNGDLYYYKDGISEFINNNIDTYINYNGGSDVKTTIGGEYVKTIGLAPNIYADYFTVDFAPYSESDLELAKKNIWMKNSVLAVPLSDSDGQIVTNMGTNAPENSYGVINETTNFWQSTDIYRHNLEHGKVQTLGNLNLNPPLGTPDNIKLLYWTQDGSQRIENTLTNWKVQQGIQKTAPTQQGINEEIFVGLDKLLKGGFYRLEVDYENFFLKALSFTTNYSSSLNTVKFDVVDDSYTPVWLDSEGNSFESEQPTFPYTTSDSKTINIYAPKGNESSGVKLDLRNSSIQGSLDLSEVSLREIDLTNESGVTSITFKQYSPVTCIRTDLFNNDIQPTLDLRNFNFSTYFQANRNYNCTEILLTQNDKEFTNQLTFSEMGLNVYHDFSKLKMNGGQFDLYDNPNLPDFDFPLGSFGSINVANLNCSIPFDITGRDLKNGISIEAINASFTDFISDVLDGTYNEFQFFGNGLTGDIDLTNLQCTFSFRLNLGNNPNATRYRLNNLVSIDTLAFHQCNSLDTVDFPSGNNILTGTLTAYDSNFGNSNFVFPLGTVIQATTIEIQNNGFNQSTVDANIDNLYQNAYTGGTLKIHGNNAEPTGVYQNVTTPSSGAEKIYELVNTHNWTITFNYQGETYTVSPSYEISDLGYGISGNGTDKKVETVNDTITLGDDSDGNFTMLTFGYRNTTGNSVLSMSSGNENTNDAKAIEFRDDSRFTIFEQSSVNARAISSANITNTTTYFAIDKITHDVTNWKYRQDNNTYNASVDGNSSDNTLKDSPNYVVELIDPYYLARRRDYANANDDEYFNGSLYMFALAQPELTQAQHDWVYNNGNGVDLASQDAKNQGIGIEGVDTIGQNGITTLIRRYLKFDDVYESSSEKYIRDEVLNNNNYAKLVNYSDGAGGFELEIEDITEVIPEYENTLTFSMAKDGDINLAVNELSGTNVPTPIWEDDTGNIAQQENVTFNYPDTTTKTFKFYQRKYSLPYYNLNLRSYNRSDFGNITNTTIDLSKLGLKEIRLRGQENITQIIFNTSQKVLCDTVELGRMISIQTIDMRNFNWGGYLEINLNDLLDTFYPGNNSNEINTFIGGGNSNLVNSIDFSTWTNFNGEFDINGNTNLSGFTLPLGQFGKIDVSSLSSVNQDLDLTGRTLNNGFNLDAQNSNFTDFLTDILTGDYGTWKLDSNNLSGTKDYSNWQCGFDWLNFFSNPVTYIKIPNVTRADDLYFHDCSQLENVDLPTVNGVVTNNFWAYNTNLSTNNYVFPLGTTIQASDIQIQDNGFNQSTVDANINELYQNAYTGGILNISGNNAEPSGTYQSATTPSTGKEKIYELVNTHGWTITYWDGTQNVTQSP